MLSSVIKRDLQSDVIKQSLNRRSSKMFQRVFRYFHHSLVKSFPILIKKIFHFHFQKYKHKEIFKLDVGAKKMEFHSFL